MSTSEVIRLSRPVIGVRLPGEELELPEPKDQANEQYEQMTREILLLQGRVTQLEGELQAAREQSYNLGFQDGLAAERERHREELEAHADRIDELAGRLEQECREMLAGLEGPLMEMGFQVAEKILTIPLPDEVRENALVGTIQSFLREVLHEGGVVIHVSPENLDLIQSRDASQKLKKSFPGEIRFVADSNLGPGECTVETPEHIIDGRFKTQLAILESKTA